jgi:hypothetical protein
MSTETDAVATALRIDPANVVGLTNDPNTGALTVICTEDPGVSQEQLVVDIVLADAGEAQ